jgi:hypothetical protein
VEEQSTNARPGLLRSVEGPMMEKINVVEKDDREEPFRTSVKLSG